MAASDAKPVPIRNTALRITFPILDADGDLVTGATGLDSEFSEDGATFADAASEATEIATASGMYFLDMASTEVDGDTVAVIVKTTSSGAKTTPIVMYPQSAANPIQVNVQSISGDSVAADNAEAFFDGTGYAGTNNVIPTVTTVNGLAANTITATAIQNDAITAAKIANAAIDAATFATGAIDAAALAADASTEIRSLASGTSDSGTTTTMVDAARTEADTDYWVGQWLVPTSGNILGQARQITAFNAATDTITVSPALTQAWSTQTYEIWPGDGALRPTVAGRTLDVSTGGEAGLDWANVGTQGSTVTLSATTINDLTTKTGFSLSTAGVDAIWDEPLTEPSGVFAWAGTFRNLFNWMGALARNKITQTATTQTLRNDADSGNLATSTVSDDGTTATRGEWT